jgi:hypothetical protein
MTLPQSGASAEPHIQVRVRVRGDLHHGQVPDGAVYIGRATPTLPASPFANPYKVSRFGRQGALTLYSQYLDDRPELVERARAELAGRAVACWCKPADRCHGDELQDRIAEPPVAPHSWRGASRSVRSCTTCSMSEESRQLAPRVPPVRIYQHDGRLAVPARMPACGTELAECTPEDAKRGFWQAALDAHSALGRRDFGQAFRLLQEARIHQPGNPNLDRYEQQVRDALAAADREAQ